MWKVAFFLLSVCVYPTEIFEQKVCDGWGQQFDISEVVFEGRAGSVDALVFENTFFGRVLAIDDAVYLTEKDEAIYHEMLVHPALISHGKPLSVLILSPLPNGVLREVLRHKDVEKALCLGANRSLVDLGLEELPFLGKCTDSRAEIRFEDAFTYLQGKEELFDVILVDGKGPLEPESYNVLRDHLTDGGILIDSCGVPFLDEESFQLSVKNRKTCFDTVRFYMVPIATHLGGAVAFGWSSDVRHDAPLETLKKRQVKISGELKYYTPQMQKASFAIPHFLVPPEKEPKSK